MKRFKRFGRYGLLGIANTVLGYAMFVGLSKLFSNNQILASVITEVSMQLFKYYGLGKFVFVTSDFRRPPLHIYLLGIAPGCLVVFGNVAILSHFTPAYITGLIGLVVSFVYYKIFKRLYRSSERPEF